MKAAEGTCCCAAPAVQTAQGLPSGCTCSHSPCLFQIDLLKSKLKFDDAFNYKTTDDWSKKLKEMAPGAPNPCHCCSQTCPAKIHVP